MERRISKKRENWRKVEIGREGRLGKSARKDVRQQREILVVKDQSRVLTCGESPEKQPKKDQKFEMEEK